MHSSETVGKKRAGEVDLYIASRLRAARTQRQITQQQLAEQVGVTHQQIRKYEIGVSRVSARTLYQFALALGQPLSFFFPYATEQGSRESFCHHRYFDDVVKFMNTTESLELSTTFLSISNSKVRRQVLALLRVIANDFTPAARTRSRTKAKR